MLTQIIRYLVVAAVAATLTYVFTSKADEERYVNIFETQNKTIEKLQQLVDKQAKLISKKETHTVIIYDPKTGNKVKEETKIVEKKKETSSEKTEVVKEKETSSTTKESKVVEKINKRANTILVGAGTNLDLDKLYSVQYIRRWEWLNLGSEFRSDKSVSIFTGVSF